MTSYSFNYGSASVDVELELERFDTLRPAEERPAMSDAELGQALDSPFGSAPLEDVVDANETVLFVVPDATRQSGAGQVLNLLVRRLIANGTQPYEMAVIFATGIHRKVSEAERRSILTPFIAQRLKSFDHDPRDLFSLIELGETSNGIRVELNKKLFEYDRIIIIGSVGFHYFAGFSGGRKLICPGLASSRTIAATHRLAFDFENLTRASGVGLGLVKGNPVDAAFSEAARLSNVAFSISTITDSAGGITAAFCGDLFAAHQAACNELVRTNSVDIKEKRDIVFVSCGGYPYDINLIQAHKALEAATNACRSGGRIILFAECRDGLGRTDLLKWFEASSSEELAERLAQKYQVNGQTAWNLYRRAEEFDISIMTDLDDQTIKAMRMRRFDPEETKLAGNLSTTGYLIPEGAHLHLTNKRG